MKRANEDGANVVPLWVYQANMDDTPLKEMQAYWTELCAGRIVPLRSEVDPREISSSLENGFILERTQPGNIRFRLAGTNLNTLMGMEVRGMPIRSFMKPTERRSFTETLDQVFDGPEIHEYLLVTPEDSPQKMTARMLILPMKSDQGTIDRALGCMISDGALGITPRRFQVAETRIVTLQDGKVHRRIEEPAMTGFAEPQHPFEPEDATSTSAGTAPKRTAGKPNLRLVTSDTWS